MQTLTTRLKLKFISCSENFKFYYLITTQDEYLVVENFDGYKKYLSFQLTSLKIEVQQKFLILKYTNFFIYKLYKNFIQNLSNKTLHQLSLNGIGWNIFLFISKDNTFQYLELKLGFSQKLKIIIPNTLSVFVNKKKIFIEGYNSVLVGNFIAKLQSYKPVNLYTGKGFLKKREFFNLKEIKKA